MAYQDNTSNAVALPIIIAQKALGYFGSYMNLARTVARDFDYEAATYGKTISVTKRGVLTANSKAANANVVVQNPTMTKIDVNLDQHFEVTFGIDDVTKVLQRMDTQEGYAQDAATVLAEKVENYLASLYSSVTATPIVFDATSSATIDASMRAIRKYFVTQKVPKLEARHGYVGSGIYDKLLSVDQYRLAQNLGLATGSKDNDGVIQTGRLSGLYGINDIFESQSVVVTGTSPSSVERGLFYTKDAIILAARPLPAVPDGYGAKSTVIYDENVGMGLRVVSSFNPQSLAMQVTLDILFGAAINDQRRIVPVNYTS